MAASWLQAAQRSAAAKARKQELVPAAEKGTAGKASEQTAPQSQSSRQVMLHCVPCCPRAFLAHAMLKHFAVLRSSVSSQGRGWFQGERQLLRFLHSLSWNMLTIRALEITAVVLICVYVVRVGGTPMAPW